MAQSFLLHCFIYLFFDVYICLTSPPRVDCTYSGSVSTHLSISRPTYIRCKIPLTSSIYPASHVLALKQIPPYYRVPRNSKSDPSFGRLEEVLLCCTLSESERLIWHLRPKNVVGTGRSCTIHVLREYRMRWWSAIYALIHRGLYCIECTRRSGRPRIHVTIKLHVTI